MLCEESNHLWLGRFALRLTQLRTDISWPRAVMRAVAAHAYCSDLEPEYAALLDASVATWSLPSKRSGSPVSPHA
jgi:hypothetical protein